MFGWVVMFVAFAGVTCALGSDPFPTGEFVASESMDRSEILARSCGPHSELSYSLMREDVNAFKQQIYARLDYLDPSTNLPELLDIYVDSISHPSVTEDNFENVQIGLFQRLLDNDEVREELQHRGVYMGVDMGPQRLIPVEVSEYFIQRFNRAVTNSINLTRVSGVSLVVTFVSFWLCMFGPGCSCCPQLVNVAGMETTLPITIGACCFHLATRACSSAEEDTARQANTELEEIIARERQYEQDTRQHYRLNPINPTRKKKSHRSRGG